MTHRDVALPPPSWVLVDSSGKITPPWYSHFQNNLNVSPIQIASGSFPVAATLDVTIPAWVKRMTIAIAAVSCDTATRYPRILASTDSGASFNNPACLGYNSTPALVTDTGMVSVFTAVAAARSWNIGAEITGVNGGGHVGRWVGSTDDLSVIIGTASSFDADTDRITHIRFAWNGSGSFDGGTYNVVGTG